MTSLQRLAPTKSARVYLHMGRDTLHKYTHIVMHVPASSAKVCTNCAHVYCVFCSVCINFIFPSTPLVLLAGVLQLVADNRWNSNEVVK